MRSLVRQGKQPPRNNGSPDWCGDLEYTIVRSVNLNKLPLLARIANVVPLTDQSAVVHGVEHDVQGFPAIHVCDLVDSRAN